MKIYKVIIIIIILILIFINIRYNLKVNNQLTILQLNNPSKNILEDNLNLKSPTVITNSMTKWDDLELFSPQKLSERNIKIELKLNTTISEQQKTDLVITSSTEFLKWILANENREPSQKFYLSENEQFLRDFDLYQSFDKFANYYLSPMSIGKSYPVWIGTKGTKTGIHWDPEYRNIICQLYGTKKIYLFSPEQSKFMYPSDKYDNGGIASSVDFWNIDQQKFPDFNNTQYMEIILHPGQMLFIPKYWWHACENMTTCVSIGIRSYIPSDLITGIPNVCCYIGHKLGIYKKNHCTCHN